MVLPDDILEHRIDSLGADDLEDRALRVHTMNEANHELGEEFERSVGEIKGRLLAMGVSEQVIDQVVIGQIIGDTTGNAEVAYAVERLRGTLGYQAEQLDQQMIGVHKAMKGNHKLEYRVPFTLPDGSSGYLSTSITQRDEKNYKFSRFANRNGVSSREGDETRIEINLYKGNNEEYNPRGRFLGVEITDHFLRDAPVSRWGKFRGKTRETTKSIKVKFGISKEAITTIANRGIKGFTASGPYVGSNSQKIFEKVAELMQNPQNKEQERIQYVTAAAMGALQQVVPRVAEHLRYQHKTLDQLDFNGRK